MGLYFPLGGGLIAASVFSSDEDIIDTNKSDHPIDQYESASNPKEESALSKIHRTFNLLYGLRGEPIDADLEQPFAKLFNIEQFRPYYPQGERFRDLKLEFGHAKIVYGSTAEQALKKAGHSRTAMDSGILESDPETVAKKDDYRLFQQSPMGQVLHKISLTNKQRYRDIINYFKLYKEVRTDQSKRIDSQIIAEKITRLEDLENKAGLNEVLESAMMMDQGFEIEYELFLISDVLTNLASTQTLTKDLDVSSQQLYVKADELFSYTRKLLSVFPSGYVSNLYHRLLLREDRTKVLKHKDRISHLNRKLDAILTELKTSDLTNEAKQTKVSDLNQIEAEIKAISKSTALYCAYCYAFLIKHDSDEEVGKDGGEYKSKYEGILTGSEINHAPSLETIVDFAKDVVARLDGSDLKAFAKSFETQVSEFFQFKTGQMLVDDDSQMSSFAVSALQSARDFEKVLSIIELTPNSIPVLMAHLSKRAEQLTGKYALMDKYSELRFDSAVSVEVLKSTDTIGTYPVKDLINDVFTIYQHRLEALLKADNPDIYDVKACLSEMNKILVLRAHDLLAESLSELIRLNPSHRAYLDQLQALVTSFKDQSISRDIDESYNFRGKKFIERFAGLREEFFDQFLAFETEIIEEKGLAAYISESKLFKPNFVSDQNTPGLLTRLERVHREFPSVLTDADMAEIYSAFDLMILDWTSDTGSVLDGFKNIDLNQSFADYEQLSYLMGVISLDESLSSYSNFLSQSAALSVEAEDINITPSTKYLAAARKELAGLQTRLFKLKDIKDGPARHKALLALKLDVNRFMSGALVNELSYRVKEDGATMEFAAKVEFVWSIIEIIATGGIAAKSATTVIGMMDKVRKFEKTSRLMRFVARAMKPVRKLGSEYRWAKKAGLADDAILTEQGFAAAILESKTATTLVKAGVEAPVFHELGLSLDFLHGESPESDEVISGYLRSFGMFSVLGFVGSGVKAAQLTRLKHKAVIRLGTQLRQIHKANIIAEHRAVGKFINYQDLTKEVEKRLTKSMLNEKFGFLVAAEMQAMKKGFSGALRKARDGSEWFAAEAPTFQVYGLCFDLAEEVVTLEFSGDWLYNLTSDVTWENVKLLIGLKIGGLLRKGVGSRKQAVIEKKLAKIRELDKTLDVIRQKYNTTLGNHLGNPTNIKVLEQLVVESQAFEKILEGYIQAAKELPREIRSQEFEQKLASLSGILTTTGVVSQMAKTRHAKECAKEFKADNIIEGAKTVIEDTQTYTRRMPPWLTSLLLAPVFLGTASVAGGGSRPKSIVSKKTKKSAKEVESVEKRSDGFDLTIDPDTITGILNSCCSNHADVSSKRVYYSDYLPTDLFDSGKVTFHSIERAKKRGWRIIEQNGREYLIPADKFMQQILPASDYSVLLTAGIAEKDIAKKSSDLLMSPLDIFVETLFTLCENNSSIKETGGRELWYSNEFAKKYLTSSALSLETLSRSVYDGWTIITFEDVLFVVSPDQKQYIKPEDLKSLADIGIISFRTSKQSPYYEAPVKSVKTEQLTYGLRTPAKGELELDDFIIRQFDRWSSKLETEINLENYSWLSDFPELGAWLKENKQYIEKGDLDRLDFFIKGAKKARSIHGVEANMNSILGIIAEIKIRPDIISAYRDLLRKHPDAIIMFAPQIYSGDILEASDAVVGEVVLDAQGKKVFKIYSAWELTSTETGAKETKLQLTNTLDRRFSQKGLHIRDAEGLGVTLTVDSTSLITTERKAQTVDPRHLRELTDLIRSRLLIEFDFDMSSTFRQVATKEGKRRSKLYKELIANESLDTPTKFLEVLKETDTKLAVVFENLISTNKPRKVAKELSEILRLDENTVRKWQGVFDELCAQRGWEYVRISKKVLARKRGLFLRNEYDRLLKDKFLNTREKFRDALQAVDSVLAAIFADMTLKDGTLKSPILFSKELDCSPDYVRKWRKKFGELCKKRGWEIAKMSNDLESRKRGALLRKKYALLLKDKSLDTSEEFLIALRELDSSLGVIFGSLISKDGKQKSLRAISLELRFTESRAYYWQSKFKELCKQRGWVISGK